MNFNIVVATAQNNGIGKAGSLPWRLKGDMAFFKKVTSFVPSTEPNRKNAVIMGRKTWESIPAKFRPLPGRLNVILSRNAKDLRVQTEGLSDVRVHSSLSEALGELQKTTDIFRVFLIGGGEVYNQGIQSNFCKRIILTKVHSNIECDTFFPEIPPSFTSLPIENLEQFTDTTLSRKLLEENGIPYEFCLYEKSDD
ncbi:hypothetical protein K7432_012144 [Basidiobolus ranarum]|uniref:Dihydrofolate reductase n=1 Tax=Basidiobolus ranarum TaxID=34480 RepID=A0ABR2VSQ6_9FUNG